MKAVTRTLFVLTALAVGLPGFAFADNAIKRVQVRNDGDVVLVKVEMSGPVTSAPGNWSIVEPPRVVFDFPATDNKSGTSAMSVGKGDLKTLNLVQSDKLTRLVLNLYRTTRYSTEIDGSQMFIKLEPVTSAQATSGAPSAFASKAPATPTKVVGAPGAAVRDVIFRRGEDGQGVILVDLSDGSIPVDVRRTATGLLVDLADVEIPARLQSRRDVTDFATPVSSFVTRPGSANSTRIEVAAKGKWFHQAQVANNQLVIEIKHIPAEDMNKLVQRDKEGQKVSINFFEAESTMVLRTLAEISGKNVLVDPSLAGKRVTVALENIPYDQALDIVMTQVNAAMRIRDNVVLFGDRAVLQKRDQDAADAAARAADTMPLQTEVFQLNYLKPTDFQKLLKGASAAGAVVENTSGPSGGALAPAGDSGEGGAARTATPTGAREQPTGSVLLSARGKIFSDDPSQKLFVTDIPPVIDAIRAMLREMDVAPKQVMIEARVVEASTAFTNTLGVRLRLFGQTATGGASIDNARLGFGVTTGVLGAGVANRSSTLFAPSYTVNPNAGMLLFNRAGTRLLSLELAAQETDGGAKTISTPRLVTKRGAEGEIKFQRSVSYVSGINAQTGLPTYANCAAPISLKVTPDITPDNRVSMKLDIARGTLALAGAIGAQTCTTNTNTLKTGAIVENGGTLVIGGIAVDEEENGTERVPFLGDLPYVGFLFKTQSKRLAKSEVLMFITPRILSSELGQAAVN